MVRSIRLAEIAPGSNEEVASDLKPQILITASTRQSHCGHGLDSPAASTENQVKKHDQQDQAEPTTAVVTDAGTCVVSATAKQQNEYHDYEYERHDRKSSTVQPGCEPIQGSGL